MTTKRAKPKKSKPRVTLTSLAAEMRSALAMLSQRMESYSVIVDHCARLLKEKEILQRRLDAMLNPPTLTWSVVPSPDYMLPANKRFHSVIYACGCGAQGHSIRDRCTIHHEQIRAAVPIS